MSVAVRGGQNCVLSGMTTSRRPKKGGIGMAHWNTPTTTTKILDAEFDLGAVFTIKKHLVP